MNSNSVLLILISAAILDITSAALYKTAINHGNYPVRRRDEARLKHYTSIKQELVEQEVKECTFSPNMIALAHSKRILKNKELRENMAKEMEQDGRHSRDFVEAKFEKINNGIAPKEKKADPFDFRLIRKMLKEEMHRMKL